MADWIIQTIEGKEFAYNAGSIGNETIELPVTPAGATAGYNSIAVGADIKGATITGNEAGNNLVSITGAVSGFSTISLGDGNDKMTIGDYVEHSTISLGDGDDSLKMRLRV